MSSAAELRELATRLLALAVDAQSRGELAYSDMLVQRAGEYMDQAEALESGAAPPPPPAPVSEAPAQQQQQPQPKREE
jgi:hypothetical protein